MGPLEILNSILALVEAQAQAIMQDTSTPLKDRLRTLEQLSTAQTEASAALNSLMSTLNSVSSTVRAKGSVPLINQSK